MEHPQDSEPTVWLWRDRHQRPQAHCDCGWNGRPRWRRSAASTDALMHSARTLHLPADPIDKWTAVRRYNPLLADLHAAAWMLAFVVIMGVALGYSVVPS